MGINQDIDVTTKQRKTVLALLEKHLPNTTAWVYGSRAKWTSRPQSDLDLVVFATPEQNSRVSDLREAFEESNLPFRVDLFVWDEVPEQFRRHIEAERAVLVEREERGVGGGWRTATLGEVVTLQRGFDLPTTERKLGSYPVIASTGPVGTHNRAIVQAPGVVIGRSGSLGGGQFIKQDFWPLNTTLWVKDFNNNDPRFCYFLLKSLDLGQFNAGSGVPTLNRNHIHPLPVRVPPLSEQRAIGHILGTLDDKIELNRRMNETLEEMARALFKSWFVDFLPVRAKQRARRQTGDPVRAKAALKRSSLITPPQEGSDWSIERARAYLPAARGLAQAGLDGMDSSIADLFPDRLVDSELGEIPEGWEAKTLSHCVTLNPESWSRMNTPEHIDYVDLANTKWGIIEVTQHFAWKDAPSRAKRILRAGDSIVGTVRPGNGSYSLIGHEGLTGSTGFAVLRPMHLRYREFVYLAVTTAENIERLARRADGAAYPAVRPDVVAETEVAMPSVDNDLLSCFSKAVAPILDRVESNKTESHALAAHRDALLPKLVSGSLRVTDDRLKGYERQIP